MPKQRISLLNLSKVYAKQKEIDREIFNSVIANLEHSGRFSDDQIKELETYDGMHCFNIWKRLTNRWVCPVCRRNRYEVLQWGNRVGSNARNYGPVGWKGGFHNHHDHGNRWSNTILICGGCNALEGRMKRLVGTVKNWSFSAQELNSSFTEMPKAHTPIKDTSVNVELLAQIYDEWPG